MSDEERDTVPERRAQNQFDFLKYFPLIALAVCTALCVIFMRIPFLSIFYLAPLGCAVMLYGSYLVPFIAAAAVHAAVCLITGTFAPNDILYMTAMFFVFAWMIGGKALRTLYRFFITAAAGTIGFFVIINPADSFNVLYEQIVTELAPGASVSGLMEMVNNVLLRGGALVSMCLMYLANRQLALTAAWIVKRRRNDRKLTDFFAPAGLIWVLSGAIATILLSVLSGIVILEIIAWNVFIICAIIYLAQGAGILLHIIAKRSSAFRTGILVLAVALLISPFSLIAVAAMLILGIAENWVPIRTAKKTL